MTKLFLHVGLPKTGTSYLQNSFELFEKKSHFKNICYPIIKEHKSFLEIGSGNAVDIGHYLSPRLTPHFDATRLNELIDILLSKVEGENKTVLFSSEFFSTAPANRVSVMKEYLVSKGYEIELIVVVRPLRELLFSAYMQNVKREALKTDFCDWVEPVAQRLPDSYIRNITFYNLPVHVVKYDRDNLLSSILNLLGEEPTSGAMTKAVVNRSLSRSEMEILKCINAVYNDAVLSTKISNQFVEFLSDKKPASMTNQEHKVCEKSIIKWRQSLKGYDSKVAEDMVKYFLDSPGPNTAKLNRIDGSKIDTAAFNIALNVIKANSTAISTGIKTQSKKRTQIERLLGQIIRPYVDELKEAAIKVEKISCTTALTLMEFAVLGRPHGKVICAKIAGYRNQVKKTTDDPSNITEIASLLFPYRERLGKILDELKQVDSINSSKLEPLVSLAKSGKIDRLLPPEEFQIMSHTDDNFRKIGNAHVNFFIDELHLRPDDKILEIGSGNGRIARALTDFLVGGEYTGVDIMQSFVEWCTKAYSPYKNFSFEHIDVFNQYYNTTGTKLATQLKFRFNDESFDFIYLTSVFTHMLKEEIDNYLGEVYRMLKKGGTCYITYFILDDQTISLIEEQKTNRRFIKFDEVSSVSEPDMPEAAVAYKLVHLKKLYKSKNFKIKNIYYGKWRGRESLRKQVQDGIVAIK